MWTKTTITQNTEFSVHFASVSLKFNYLQGYGNNQTVYAPYHVTFTNNMTAFYQQHGSISF